MPLYIVHTNPFDPNFLLPFFILQGTLPTSDFSIEAGKPGCQSKNQAYQSEAKVPSWKEITKDLITIKVQFDMANDLEQKETKEVLMQNQEVYVRYRRCQWESSADGHYFHLFDRCALGGSGDVESHKICASMLILRYNERTGDLTLDKDGFTLAKSTFTKVPDAWKDRALARVEYGNSAMLHIRKGVGYLPCNIQWSNAQKFHFPTSTEGKCLRFAAASQGNIYVVFAAVPAKPSTWYYFEISPEGVGILKVREDNFHGTLGS